MKYFYLSLMVICACNSAQKNENIISNPNPNPNTSTLSQLLSDTFVENESQSIVDSDSLDKAILHQLNYKNLKEIDAYDVEKLITAYSDLLNYLNKMSEVSQLEQNPILFTIFEKLNTQQTKLDERTEIEIKTKLKLARLKSEIWPYFKK